MHGESIADAGIRESGSKHRREENEKNAGRRTGEAKNHPAILCIDKLSDARRKSGEKVCERGQRFLEKEGYLPMVAERDSSARPRRRTSIPRRLIFWLSVERGIIKRSAASV